MYHPYCPIQWGDIQSEKNCWLGDEKVPLPDVDTQNPKVVSAYTEWVKDFVQEYNIDGLRIDGTFVYSSVAHVLILNSSCQVRSLGNRPLLRSNPIRRHTNTDFWPKFCGAAGVFCMGEVFGDDLE